MSELDNIKGEISDTYEYQYFIFMLTIRYTGATKYRKRIIMQYFFQGLQSMKKLGLIFDAEREQIM